MGWVNPILRRSKLKVMVMQLFPLVFPGMFQPIACSQRGIALAMQNVSTLTLSDGESPTRLSSIPYLF